MKGLGKFFLEMVERGGGGGGVVGCVSFSLCSNAILLLVIMNFLSIFG